MCIMLIFSFLMDLFEKLWYNNREQNRILMLRNAAAVKLADVIVRWEALPVI